MKKSKAINLDGMSPAEIMERGRQLMQLARAKETEIKEKSTKEVGKLILAEIVNKWPTDPQELFQRISNITGLPVTLPPWLSVQVPTVPAERPEGDEWTDQEAI